MAAQSINVNHWTANAWFLQYKESISGRFSLVTLVTWLVVTSMDRQIHKRLTLQVLLDRNALEHGESSQNKQERKSSNSTQETTSILELMVDWVQNKHRCKEASSTLRYQWKGKEKEGKKTNRNFQSSQSSKLGEITTVLGQDFSPEVHFQGKADPQERGYIVTLKPAKNLTDKVKKYNQMLRVISITVWKQCHTHVLSELLLCIAKWKHM